MPSPTLVSIAVTTLPTTLNYAVGANFSSTGIVVTGTYSDASTAVVTPDSYSGFDSSLSNYGQIITVTKGAVHTTFQVNIVSATLVPYALTTIQKVEALIGLPTSATNDALIGYLINSVSTFIQDYCGNKQFLSQSYSNEIYDAKPNVNEHGGSTIFLHQFPVSTLTSIEYRGGTITSPIWTAYNANSYMLYDKTGMVKFFMRFPYFPQGLRINYTAGYKIDFNNEFNSTLHTLPFQITSVATELVAKAYQLRQSQGIKSQSVEGQSVTFDNSMTAEQKAVLGSFTVRRMAI